METREDPYEIEVPDIFQRLEIRGVDSVLDVIQVAAIGLKGTSDKGKHIVTFVPFDFTRMQYIREQLPEILRTLKLTKPDLQILFF